MSSERQKRPRLRYRAGLPPRRRTARAAGGTVSRDSDYGVSIDLPDNVPIAERELRAIEILLGNSLKEVLAATPGKPLKYRTK